MLAPPNMIPTNFSLYQNKLIRIISPFSGEQFKIELGGKEEEFRELLATLLNIEPSYIKGLKDSYGNYYTLSSALNDLFIFSNENNLFSLVLNISIKNNNNNKYNHYNDSFNKNMLYSVNNNYHNRTEFNEIYIGNSNKKIKKSKSNFRYTTLIKQLIPAINRNFRDKKNIENESFFTEKWSLSRHPKFEKILNNIKTKFSKEQYKILKELLKMENMTIINYFQSYEKTKDKKDLLKNLNSLYKKYHKKVKNDSSSSNEESSITDSSKKSKKHSENSDTISESEESSKQNKKSTHKHNKKKETLSSSSQESKSSKSSSKSKSKDNSNSKESSDKDSNSKSKEESEEEENSDENKNNFPIKCSSLEDVIDNIKELFNNKLIVSCLFTNDIDFLKKTETQKTQLLKEEFGIKNFTITENSYEAIKNYYENIMKNVIEKNMTEEEKKLLHKLIKKNNKTIKLRFRALFRHNNYELLASDLKEGMKDHLKRKKGSEHKINLKKNNKSISINSNSNSSNENDNENENEGNNYGDDNSSKSIRKNERMAKNNKKKNDQKSQKSQKSKEEESVEQFKLMEMNNDSKDDSTSKKSENFSKSRKSSSKIANEKEDDNIENNFIPLIKKMKDEGNLNITDNEINILINEFNKKNRRLLAFIEEYQQIKDQEELIESIKTLIKDLYAKKVYIEGEKVDVINNDDNNNYNNNNNLNEEEKPFEKEIITGLKGQKFGKKGNKKIINILLKNNVFTKEQMRNIEEDLDQNNNFIVGAFELIYITMNVKDLVENINIRLQLSQSEKENQIKTNLEIIMKSFTEEEQNKVRELYEAKDANLMNILESEMNDIKKAKTNILNFLEKN